MLLERNDLPRIVAGLLALLTSALVAYHENVFEDLGPSAAPAVRIGSTGAVLAACLAAAYWIPKRILEQPLLRRMTAQTAPNAVIHSDEDLPWDSPLTHLRYNARRMRFNASLALFIILVAIVIALLFYAFAGLLGREIVVQAAGGSQVSVSTAQIDWPTLAARVVIGGLLVFLIQTLAGIYRYSIRMAAFYEGRAAALMLFWKRGDRLADVSMKELVDWLAGDKVEFEKAPKSPSEQVATVVKAAVEAAVKR